jgi:hypothetical protein
MERRESCGDCWEKKIHAGAVEQKLKSNSGRAERGLVVLSWPHGVVTEPNGPHLRELR